MFETCGPNELMVMSGLGYAKPLIICGGRKFVFPCFQQVQRLNLNVMKIVVDTNDVYTNQGVALKVTGVAQIKVASSHRESLERACEQFLGKSRREVVEIAKQTMAGHQRAIIGSMTVEEIYKERKVFSHRVLETASSDLLNMGLTIVSYTIRDVADDEGYLENLGRARTAEVKRDARIGEANAHKEASIAKALAQETYMASKLSNDTMIAEAQRDFELKKATFDLEIMAKKAEADLAFELQQKKTKQKIKEEEMQMKVIERQGMIQVAEEQINRQAKQLESSMKKPAEAEKYRMETLAVANRARVDLESEAQAEAERLKAEAQALAIQAKAKAEAGQMEKKAEAWKEYKDAALMEMYLSTLPQVIAEVSAPLSRAKGIKMVSSGESVVGAQKLTQEVMDIAQEVPKMVQKMTGLDISKTMKGH